MKNIFYIVLIILFISFIYIYSSSTSYYYEYSNNNKTRFTEEKIKEFEKDIENGKNVNINDYILDDSKDYSNRVTKLGNNLSDLVYKSINFILKGGYKFLEKILG